jgi:hypothetical protein
VLRPDDAKVQEGRGQAFFGETSWNGTSWNGTSLDVRVAATLLDDLMRRQPSQKQPNLNVAATNLSYLRARREVKVT